MVLLNAPTVSVHKSEILLRRGKALVRGEAIPFQSLCVILGDTAGVSVHKSEIKLGTWVTSLGKLTKKLNCSCIIAPTKCGDTIFQRPCGDGHNAIQRHNTCKEDTLQAGHVIGLFCLNHLALQIWTVTKMERWVKRTCRYIPTWPRKAGDKTAVDWVRDLSEHDRNRAGQPMQLS